MIRPFLPPTGPGAPDERAYELRERWLFLRMERADPTETMVEGRAGDRFLHLWSLSNDGSFYASRGGPPGWDAMDESAGTVGLFWFDGELVASPTCFLSEGCVEPVR